MTEQFLDERESATATINCPSCGAGMGYDIETGNLKCAHCWTMQELDDGGAVMRRKLCEDIKRSHEPWKEGAVFRCDNCGAKSVLDRTSLAKHCAYCGSSHIVASEELPGIKPDSVIPFQVTTESARKRFFKWIKSKIFAPRKLKKIDNKSEFLHQTYSSSWAYSANTISNYNGTLGRRVTTTRRVGNQTQTSTTIRYFRVSGMISEAYRDYIVPSCEQIPTRFFNRLKPFNLQQLKVYRQEFLAGIAAEHYSKCIETCFNVFANFVKRDLNNKVVRRYRADVVSHLSLNTQYNDKHFNYILLPVYVANFTYKNKRYNFYVNGASGKVVGRYPKSGWKIFFTVITLGLAAIWFAIAG